MTDTPEADPASHHSKYRLRVTAGPTYDASTHHIVHVNAPTSETIENEHITLNYSVRIKRFTGFPAESPETSPYFDHPLHKSDQYSISFSFIPKEDIPGDDLVFGNDFDRPIRDRLPPGFNQALRIVKWWIDPGLDGDAYADKPYLYGPALSSWNMFRIGDKVVDPERHNIEEWKVPEGAEFHKVVVEEGADGSGEQVRDNAGIPVGAAARKKFFLTESNRQDFVFEKGRLYQSDFYNPYLDFNDFSLKLPGFSLNVIQYVDSKSHELRYTLKNRKTGDVYAAIMFTLLFGDELKSIEANGEIKKTDEKSEKHETSTAGKVEEGSGPTKTDIPEDDDELD